MTPMTPLEVCAMQCLPPDGNIIQGSVVIERSVQEVFGYCRDFGNLPNFLGDVMAVQQIDPATSRWTIQGPFGIRAHWRQSDGAAHERANPI
jgi:uncharacterized membrane protein